MIVRTRDQGVAILLILLSLFVAFEIDQAVVPREQYVATPFAIPVLIAAYRLPPRGIVITTALAVAVGGYAAYLDKAPAVPSLFHIFSLLIVSVLALFLNRERHESARLAIDTQALLEQVQLARTTLTTVLETMPAPVIVADRTGKTTLANAAAQKLFGGAAPDNVFQFTEQYQFERFDGAPLPARDLPLSRAVTSGTTTTDMEVRLRREDGFEAAILASASPVRDAAGVVVGGVEVLVDITKRAEIEAALRASQESLARAQQIAHLGNWDRDLRTGHLTWSDEIYRIFGITPENFAGTLDAFLQRVHPADRAWVARVIKEELQNGRPYSLDHRIIRPDGTVRVVHEEAAGLRDSTGRLVRVVGTIQDITERKRAEEERERLLQQVQIERARVEAILNSTANGIIYVDAATEKINPNAAAVRLFGHPFETEGGQDQYVRQILHPDGRPVAREDLPSRAAISGQTTAPAEFVVLRPSGERIPVLESAAPVRDPEGRVVGAVLVFQDISALKDLERLREEWTSIIAHDLRQPVTVIIGYATLLEAKARETAVSSREVGHILTSARRLAKMIEDLLDVSRIETRHLTLRLEPVDLPALMKAIVERAETVAPGHRVEARVIGSVAPVLADPGRIEQALGNLLSNAAKYGSPGSEITVTIQQHGSAAEVAVCNVGRGIPPEEIPGLFTRFHRTRNARGGGVSGLGLGLYITRGIVEAHHGRIWVESTPGETTTFTFSLPVATKGGTS